MIERMICLFLLLILPVTANATEKALNELLPHTLVEHCVAAIEVEADFALYAEELRSRQGINLVPEQRFRGMKCLKANYEEKFFFDVEGGQFVSETEEQQRLLAVAVREAQLNEIRASAARGRRDRQLELVRRLAAACYELLVDDSFRALTEPECVEIFLANGFDQ